MASELKLNMHSGGYAKVNNSLKLNIKTFANFPLRSHTIDDIKEASYFDIYFFSVSTHAHFIFYAVIESCQYHFFCN